MYVCQCDCPSAYLNGRLPENIYLYLPEGHEKKNKENSVVYSCPSSIYGLAVAGRVWYIHFRKIVIKRGYKPSKRAPTLFYKDVGETRVYLVLYVDDFLLGCKTYEILEKELSFFISEFQVKYTFDVKKFVGFELERSKNKLFLHQEDKILSLGLDYRIEKAENLPLMKNLKFNEVDEKMVDLTPLQKIFGELNYLVGSRPDISYVVNQIARRIHVVLDKCIELQRK